MKYYETLSREDVIFDNQFRVEMILNENYANLLEKINLYFICLLIDIKIGADSGYSFYNDLLGDYYNHKDGTFMLEITEARQDIKFLESMVIVEKKGEKELLDIFSNETSNEYKLIERELLIYIKLIKNIIADKVSI